MSRWYLVAAIVLVGCGRSSLPVDQPSVEPVAASSPKVFRHLALPDSETLPEQMRGKRVYEIGQMASAGSLSFVVSSCKWERDGVAEVEWSVTNLGSQPSHVPAAIIVSTDTLQPSLYYELDSRRTFNKEDELNPRITRSGKSYFELPKRGKFVFFFQCTKEDKDTLIDCPLSEPAYEVIR